jgi:hypothetical protein
VTIESGQKIFKMTLAKGPGAKTFSVLMGINHIGGEYKPTTLAAETLALVSARVRAIGLDDWTYWIGLRAMDIELNLRYTKFTTQT